MAEISSLSLREQFASPEQQRDSARLGMWIFLITEMMLFGAMFAAFSIYRYWYPAAFTKGSSEMELWMGAANTAILICSGFTMSLAEYSGARNKANRYAWLLLLTTLLGLSFLGTKFTEYYMHYRDHKLPGFGFIESGPQSGQVRLFFFFYFMMTGLLPVHLLIGIGLVLIMLYPVLLATSPPTATRLLTMSACIGMSSM